MTFKFSQSDKNRILEAIQEAEKQTSGEIRVHADTKCSGDPVQNAVAQFERLKMHETKDRNGVLIYIATEDRKLAIIGDQHINEKVSSDYWETTKNQLIAAFKKVEYVIYSYYQTLEIVGEAQFAFLSSFIDK